MSTAIRATGLSAAGTSLFGPFACLAALAAFSAVLAVLVLPAALAARAVFGGRASGWGVPAPSFRVSATVPSYQMPSPRTNSARRVPEQTPPLAS